MKPETASELRGMVRELLREALVSHPPSSGAVEAVRIATDAELAAFVARITAEPALAAIRAKKLRFTLTGGTASATAALDGVITEQKLDGLAAAAPIVLGPDAVLTPLARDKARRLGLKIERRR